MDSQGLGKNMIGALVRKTFTEDVCGKIFPNGPRGVKTLVFHANVHQKVTSAEEKFNN